MSFTKLTARVRLQRHLTVRSSPFRRPNRSLFRPKRSVAASALRRVVAQRNRVERPTDRCSNSGSVYRRGSGPRGLVSANPPMTRSGRGRGGVGAWGRATQTEVNDNATTQSAHRNGIARCWRGSCNGDWRVHRCRGERSVHRC